MTHFLKDILRGLLENPVEKYINFEVGVEKYLNYTDTHIIFQLL